MGIKILEAICVCFLALMIAMPIIHPDVEVRKYPGGPKLTEDPERGDE